LRRFSAVGLYEKVSLLSYTSIKVLSVPLQWVTSAGIRLQCCYFLELVTFKLWKVYSSAEQREARSSHLSGWVSSRGANLIQCISCSPKGLNMRHLCKTV